MISPSPVVVSRVPRLDEAAWAGARSWFGGTPQLGALAWPRGQKNGKPLPFAAQIDLAELAAASPSGLPSEGSLAFFLDEGAVVFVPKGSPRAPSEPPPDAIFATEPCGDIFPQNPSPHARQSFPRWPVEFTRLNVRADVPAEDDEEAREALEAAMAAAVSKRFQRRDYHLSARDAYKQIGDGAPPVWRHTAQAYAKHLRIAQFHAGDIARARQPSLDYARADVARLTPKKTVSIFGKRGAEPDEALKKALNDLARFEAADAAYRRQLADFPALIKAADDLAQGADPFALLSRAESEAFRALFMRGRKEFEDLVRFRTPFSVEDVVTGTLLAMATGDARAYAAMPTPIRDLINQRYLLPTGGWHQMFGPGIDIQGHAVSANANNLLLLQLTYDDMIDWRFGDNGVYQFWISPGDLAAGNWAGAGLTFECH